MYTARYSEPRSMRRDNGYPVRVMYCFAPSRSRMPGFGCAKRWTPICRLPHWRASGKPAFPRRKRRRCTNPTHRRTSALYSKQCDFACPYRRARRLPYRLPLSIQKASRRPCRLPCRSAGSRFKHGPPPDCITAADWISSDCILCRRRAACDSPDGRQAIRIRCFAAIPAGIPAVAGEIGSI